MYTMANQCEAKEDFEGVLTEGCVYDIILQTEYSVVVEDNEGNEAWYSRNHFKNSGYSV
jgi:hypothetical protein